MFCNQPHSRFLSPLLTIKPVIRLLFLSATIPPAVPPCPPFHVPFLLIPIAFFPQIRLKRLQHVDHDSLNIPCSFRTYPCTGPQYKQTPYREPTTYQGQPHQPPLSRMASSVAPHTGKSRAHSGLDPMSPIQRMYNSTSCALLSSSMSIRHYKPTHINGPSPNITAPSFPPLHHTGLSPAMQRFARKPLRRSSSRIQRWVHDQHSIQSSQDHDSNPTTPDASEPPALSSGCNPYLAYPHFSVPALPLPPPDDVFAPRGTSHIPEPEYQREKQDSQVHIPT